MKLTRRLFAGFPAVWAFCLLLGIAPPAAADDRAVPADVDSFLAGERCVGPPPEEDRYHDDDVSYYHYERDCIVHLESSRGTCVLTHEEKDYLAHNAGASGWEVDRNTSSWSGTCV